MLRIGTNAIISDELGQVLMVLRDDTRTWALPGGSLDLGEMPASSLAREVEEETGIKCLPVRLVGIYFSEAGGIQYLNFVFRCLVRGGTITPSKETPKVAYQYPDKIANRMLSVSRERLERGLTHAGGVPYWGRQAVSKRLAFYARFVLPVVYTAFAIRRRVTGEPAYQPPPDWGFAAFVLIPNQQGALLWVRRADDGRWNLPGGGHEKREAPWETAMREAKEETGLTVELTDLVGIYVKPAEKRIVINFTATIVSGNLTLNKEATEFAYFAVGDEPENALERHVARVAGWAENSKDGLSAPMPHMAIQ